MHSLWDKQLVWGSVISQALSIRVCVCLCVIINCLLSAVILAKSLENQPALQGLRDQGY